MKNTDWDNGREAKSIEDAKELVELILMRRDYPKPTWHPSEAVTPWEYTDIALADGSKLTIGISSGGVISLNGKPHTPDGKANINLERAEQSFNQQLPAQSPRTVNQPSLSCLIIDTDTNQVIVDVPLQYKQGQGVSPIPKDQLLKIGINDELAKRIAWAIDYAIENMDGGGKFTIFDYSHLPEDEQRDELIDWGWNGEQPYSDVDGKILRNLKFELVVTPDTPEAACRRLFVDVNHAAEAAEDEQYYLDAFIEEIGIRTKADVIAELASNIHLSGGNAHIALPVEMDLFNTDLPSLSAIQDLIENHLEMHSLDPLAAYTAYQLAPDSSLAQHWLYLSDRVASIMKLPNPQDFRLKVSTNGEPQPGMQLIPLQPISRSPKCTNHWIWTTENEAGVISITPEKGISVYGPVSRGECLDHLASLQGRIVDCSNQLANQLKSQFNYAAQLHNHLHFYQPLQAKNDQAFSLLLFREGDDVTTESETLPLQFDTSKFLDFGGIDNYLPTGEFAIATLPEAVKLENATSLINAINYGLNDGGITSGEFTVFDDGSWEWEPSNQDPRPAEKYHFHVVSNDTGAAVYDEVIRIKEQRNIPEKDELVDELEHQARLHP